MLAAAVLLAGDGWVGQLEAQSFVAGRLREGYMKDHAHFYAGLKLEESGKSVVLDVADSRLNLGAYNDGMASMGDDTATFDDAFELWKSFEYARIGGSVDEDYWDSLMVWQKVMNKNCNRFTIPALKLTFYKDMTILSFYNCCKKLQLETSAQTNSSNKNC